MSEIEFYAILDDTGQYRDMIKEAGMKWGRIEITEPRMGQATFFQPEDVGRVISLFNIDPHKVSVLETKPSGLGLFKFAPQEAERLRRFMSREGYKQVCLNRVKIELKEAEKGLETTTNDVVRLQKKLLNAVQDRGKAQGDVNRLARRVRNADTHLGAEFDKFSEIRGVEAVTVVPPKITVHTEPVSIEYDGCSYYIGVLKITINSENALITVENLNNPRSGFPHPHVDPEGIICLGNMTDYVCDLVAKQRYDVLIPFLIGYLHEYNPGDRHRDIRRWVEDDFCEDDEEFED